MAQAHAVRERLAAALKLDPSLIAITVIRTSGDRIQDRPLVDLGGKGLFTKEIEEALHAATIDLAVHSAKDVPTFLPDGMMLGACLEREDPRDVFISPRAATIADLASGSVVGTASPRRAALIQKLRPDLKVVSLRGNVETRLRKLEAGDVDATILALAGLKRLGLTNVVANPMSIDAFIPAVGQGAIAIECRANDASTRAALAFIDHADTSAALAAERAFLAVLNGSCRTPIAGHADFAGSRVRFRGMILSPDGRTVHETTREGPRDQAMELASDAGRALKALVPADFFAD
jgi:hydroxymethylbilane synthase